MLTTCEEYAATHNLKFSTDPNPVKCKTKLMDMKIKTAKYIDKNNSICQEFYFASPQTKVKLNSIYNSHFTGCQLWKLGSKEIVKMESTYNRAVKIMYELPWATHRYLIEPLSGVPHLHRILTKRYISFMKMIMNSGKTALIHLLDVVKSDVRLTTGSNLRTIMLESGMNKIDCSLDMLMSSTMKYLMKKLGELTWSRR